MNQSNLRQLARNVINKEKWWDILSRFIDVLHINIFIVDNQGAVILPPEEGKYGGGLLADRSLGFGFGQDSVSFLKKFEHHGPYLEYINPIKLHQFAIPLKIGSDILAYMIVGPVILNRRLETDQYLETARDLNIDSRHLISEMNSLRVVSHVMINSILDLLYEIVKNNIELSGIKKEIDKREGAETLPQGVKEAAGELYSTACLDELLITLLDIALRMTNTECGSIMVADKEKDGDLVIKVSRGLNPKSIQDTRVRLGQGIAGLAAQEKIPYVIHGQEGDNRIKGLLKRPEIRHSLVMPLITKNRVFGVLNVHTREERQNIENNLGNLQYLSELLSSVI